MGQTSELDEEKSSVFMLPDDTDKDVDDIIRATHRHDYSTESEPANRLNSLNSTARRGGDERRKGRR